MSTFSRYPLLYYCFLKLNTNLHCISNNFIKTLATKNNPIEKIKADMALKGLKPKEYIHSMGYWDKYIKYLSKEFKEYL